MNGFSWLHELLAISLWMAPLIALLLVIRPWLQRWIGGRGMSLVWSMVMLRLLVPIAWTIPQEWKAEVREVVERKEAVLGGKVAEVQGKIDEVEKSGDRPGFQTVLGWSWLAGMGVMAGWMLVGAVRLWRFRTEAVKDEAVLAAWERIDAKLRGRVKLRECADTTVPALVGGTIWIPSGWRLSREQWRHVLLHELGHFRRGDLWMQWAGIVVRMVYWWNPLVWLMVRAGEQDREVACDEWVRRQGEEVEAYGGTLVALARWVKGGAIPGAVMMATGRRQLHRRVEAMSRGGVAASWRGAVIGSAVLLGAVALTARAETDRGAKSNEGWDSPEFRKDYRKKNKRAYQRIQREGGLEVEFHTLETPKANASQVLEKVFQRALTDAEKAEMYWEIPEALAKRVMKMSEALYFSPTFVMIPREGANAMIEIGDEVGYPSGVPSEKKGEPLFESARLGVTLEIGVIGMAEGRFPVLSLEGRATNLIGTLDRTKGYAELPWRSLRDRTEQPAAGDRSGIPVMLRRLGMAMVTAPQTGSQYVLLRSHREVLRVGPTILPESEAAKILPDHPARKMEYWFLVRLRVISPER